MINRIKPTTAGVSIITCTRRPNSMKNIFENYNRQLFIKKEMILILHDNSMDKSIWEQASIGLGNIKIYQLDQSISLGECLNYAATKATFDIIAKFDDDDYYGSKYLESAIKGFYQADADVIGKATSYIYFVKNKILGIRNIGHENCYVHHIDGPSIILRKSVLDKVKFRDITRGEDKWFCKDCLANNIKIYSIDRFHHIYMRYSNVEDHTWSIENEKLLKWCKIVSIGEIDFKKFIDR